MTEDEPRPGAPTAAEESATEEGPQRPVPESAEESYAYVLLRGCGPDFSDARHPTPVLLATEKISLTELVARVRTKSRPTVTPEDVRVARAEREQRRVARESARRMRLVVWAMWMLAVVVAATLAVLTGVVRTPFAHRGITTSQR